MAVGTVIKLVKEAFLVLVVAEQTPSRLREQARGSQAVLSNAGCLLMS